MPSIKERVLKLNAEQSAKYVEAETARLRYWAKHPTFFGCIKCMDGRVNFSLMTGTPIGLIKPFRAIGGKFEAWWPSFLGRVRHWTETALSQGSRTFLFITYHYSASDAHLGCAGWKYDTKAARAHAERLQQNLAFVFGEELTAVVAGVETDQDLLILHGATGDLSGEMLIGKTEEEVLLEIGRLFPETPEAVRKDLVPFLFGNATHVQDLKQNPRNLKEKQHDERVIAVGQSFDWLALANLALIINDADPNLAESIRVAGSLIEKNLANEPIGHDALVCTNIPYRSPGLDYRQAVARSLGLRDFAEKILREFYPALMDSGRVGFLSSVMWEPSKRIEELPSVPPAQN
ncbi:MAG: hypothetical protein WA001_00140 [Patescibacteria group bacterium]